MRCLRCGFSNPAGFRFCGRCGEPLGPDDAAATTERKLVTALFCDLAGFTQRAETLDPEDVHRLLSPYFATVRAELERFGGTVEKFIGDAIFALFGAPRAHEDDPERAVRAALAIRDAVAKLNEDAAEPGLHVRIGITTGEAMVAVDARRSEGEGMAWGDALNTSFRLQAAAPVDSVLVDEATYRATRQTIDYEQADPVEAKGKTEPIPVWTALGPRARRGADVALAGEAPLVGRSEELALLVETLYRARRHRTAELVTLVGPAGLGKSRLVFELFRAVEAGSALIHWRQGRSPPYHDGATFWALGEIVKGHAGILETDDAETAAAKLAEAVRGLVPGAQEAARIEGHLRPLVGLGGEASPRGDERGAAFAAWRHFFEAIARHRPLVLVFEDLHWADDGLLEFIEHLVEWAKGVPLLIVTTARPGLLERRRGWAGKARTTTVTLSPLSEAETEALAASLAGDEPLAVGLSAAIVGGAAGNPLYAVEYVRMLADRGLLHGGAAEEGLPVPESIQGVIAARLDGLPADEKALLQEGAVVGRAVWAGALAAIGGRSKRWVDRRLRTLERKEFLVRARRSSVEREDEYRFRHVLVRDVAYGQIPRHRRGEIHRRAAEWLDTLSPDRAVDRAEMLAHHYLCALELGRATGAATQELVDRARVALRDAGERAFALYGFPAAARYFSDALALFPETDPVQPQVLFALGRARYYAETGGADVLAEARDRLIGIGDLGTAAEAESLLGMLAQQRGEREQMFEHVRRAASLVETLGPARSKAEVLVDLAGALMVADENEPAIEVAREALQIAEATGLESLPAHALGIMGNARWHLGDPRGEGDLERSIAISEEIDSHMSAYGYGSLADLKAATGDLRRAAELHAKALQQARRFGHAGNVRWLEAERVGECYWSGRWDEAVEAADRHLGEPRGGTSHFMDAYCQALRGRIRLARDDIAAALDDAEEALGRARAVGELQLLYPALGFHARALASAGSSEGATARVDELLELWRSNLHDFPPSSWVADLGFLAGPLDRRADVLREAEGTGTRTRWLEAALALASDDFGRAATLFSEIGSAPDEALARLNAAGSLFSTKHAREAESQLELALDFYRRVGAVAHLRDAETLLPTSASL